MKKLVLNIIFCSIVLSLTVPLYADKQGPATVAVFGIPGKNRMLNTLTTEITSRVKNLFNEMGRFIPVEDIRVKKALELADSGVDAEALFAGAATSMDTDIYVLIGLYQLMGITYADLRVYALNPFYKNLEIKAVLRSKIILNLPLKIERELAYIHDSLPVHAKIIKKNKRKPFSHKLRPVARSFPGNHRNMPWWISKNNRDRKIPVCCLCRK